MANNRHEYFAWSTNPHSAAMNIGAVKITVPPYRHTSVNAVGAVVKPQKPIRRGMTPNRDTPQRILDAWSVAQESFQVLIPMANAAVQAIPMTSAKVPAHPPSVR